MGRRGSIMDKGTVSKVIVYFLPKLGLAKNYFNASFVFSLLFIQIKRNILIKGRKKFVYSLSNWVQLKQDKFGMMMHISEKETIINPYFDSI